MKLLLTSFFSILTLFAAFGQDLSFAVIGSEPAYCRLFDYQNGNGQVYAAATGGTPDYTYEWENLATGETAGVTTWGGLNPGDYQITVTDGLGNTITSVVTVDSLNPIADFNVVSDDLIFGGGTYNGDAPVEVQFVNSSENFANPLNPLSDTTFFFRPHSFADWTVYHDYFADIDYTYEFGGTYTPSMIAMNKNGCTDTTSKTIVLSGPAGIDNNGNSTVFSIQSHTLTNEVVITQSGFENELVLNIYTLSGQRLFQHQLADTETRIPFARSNSIYLYELQDKASGSTIHSGKFSF